MHVLFVNPNRIQPPVAPLAADYLGEALRRSGIGMKVADLCADVAPGSDVPAGYWKRCLSGNPAAILVTFRNLDDAYYFSRVSFLPQVRDLVETLRGLHPAPIILGGSGFSVAPARILDFCRADLGISGSQERDLVRLVENLHRADAYPEIPGLVWRDGDAVRINPPSPPEMTEDFFSPRRFVDNRAYFHAGGMVGIETKRGCPGACRYCVDPLGKGRTVFTKPMTVLIREVESLVDQGATVFHLCDSEFNIPREHALTVCRAFQEEGLGQRIRWFTYASPEGFDTTLATEMRKAGCAGINFGVDHCHPDLLEALGRTHRAEDLERCATAARTAGIPVLFDLLLGGPGETRETLGEAIEFFRALDVPRVGANCGIRIYPNTPLAEQVLGQGLLQDNPNLRGQRKGNQDLLDPVFYVSGEMGNHWEAFLASLVEGDERFFLPLKEIPGANYNYNENDVLVRALREGHRGAFWDILRRVQEGLPPLSLPGS